MIPKVIHYCWFGPNKISKKTKKYINTWKKYCPDFEIIEWNEENFDINSNKFVLDAYNAGKYAFVSDYVRLYIVHKYGGIYLDTDVELFKTLDNQLLNHKAFFAIQQSDNLATTGLGFGAEKGNELIKKLFSMYNKIDFNSSNIKNIACPILITDELYKIGFQRKNATQYLCNGDVVVFSSEYFDPISPSTTLNLKSTKTYSMHHYAASWLSKNKRTKRKIANLVGQTNINRIKKFLKKIKRILHR